jgi:thioredoxin 1
MEAWSGPGPSPAGLESLYYVAFDAANFLTEKGPLMASEKVQTLTDTNFDQSVIKANQPVVVDFWAEWCGPCRRLAPTIDELATDYDGRVVVGKLNVDENPAIQSRFSIMGIPTVLIFKGGEIVEQVVGLADKSALKKLIDKHV